MTAQHTKPDRWGVVRVVFAVVVLIVVAVSYVQDRQRIACEQTWFVDASTAIAERSAANGQTTQDWIAFTDASLAALGQPGAQTGPQIRAALTALHDSLVRVEEARRVAPIPVPPEC